MCVEINQIHIKELVNRSIQLMFSELFDRHESGLKHQGWYLSIEYVDQQMG